MIVVEDEPLIATLISKVLSDAGYQVTCCSNAVAAKREVGIVDPDGVLIDINLGAGPNGLQFGEWLHAAHPEVVQIYLTGTSDPRIWGDLGAIRKWFKKCTFLSKDKIAESNHLLSAIADALAGRKSSDKAEFANEPLLDALTRSELEVLRLAASGLTNAAIAAARSCSLRTVEQHLQAVYRALGVADSDSRNARVDSVRIFLQATGAKSILEALD